MQKDEALKILRDHKQELVLRYRLKKVGIFGSVANNTAGSESDIDVVVEMEPDLFLSIQLKEELEQLFGSKVDLIRYWKRMNHYLKQHIDKEALYV
nr:nucleotidyltransferase domain-containing protein [Chlorobium sp.]